MAMMVVMAFYIFFEGMLLLMAVVPIFMGSHRSLTATEDIAPEDMEIMTKGDAAMFPVFASGALFTMYMCFKFFGNEYVNMVLGGYFFLLGSASLTTILRPLGEMLSPASFSDEPWEFRMDRTVKVRIGTTIPPAFISSP